MNGFKLQVVELAIKNSIRTNEREYGVNQKLVYLECDLYSMEIKYTCMYVCMF